MIKSDFDFKWYRMYWPENLALLLNWQVSWDEKKKNLYLPNELRNFQSVMKSKDCLNFRMNQYLQSVGANTWIIPILFTIYEISGVILLIFLSLLLHSNILDIFHFSNLSEY